MAQKIGYEVDGTVVETLKELAPLLGRDTVTKKQVAEEYQDIVSIVDLAEEEPTDDTENTGNDIEPVDSSTGDMERMDADSESDDDGWDDKSVNTKEEDDKHPMERKDDVNKDEIFTELDEEARATLKDITPEEIKATLPEFKEEDELKEFIKDMDTATLEYLAVGMGLEWKPTYHANIHRMRIAMEFKKHFFPEKYQPKEPKAKKAKYGDHDTETLFKMASEAGIEVKKSGNEPIDRMRVIMSLKKEGVLSE